MVQMRRRLAAGGSDCQSDFSFEAAAANKKENGSEEGLNVPAFPTCPSTEAHYYHKLFKYM
jgi:hypothetical protein